MCTKRRRRLGVREVFLTHGLLLTALAPRCVGQPAAGEDPRKKEADRLAHYALFDRAAVEYGKLLEAAPEDAALRLALADVYYKDRRFEEAQKECKAVIEGNASPAQKALAHACLGDVLRKQGQREQARQEYEAAKQLAADQAGTEFAEANARVKRGLGFLDFEKAEAQKTIVYFAPDSPAKNGAQGTAQFLDSRVATTERFSGHPFTGKLEVYFLSTPEQWKNILEGWDWISSEPQEKTEYIMVGRTSFNLMRTLSFYLGNADMKDVPKSTFIANGFAAGYSGSRTWGRRVLEQASQMKQQGKIPPLAELLKSTGRDNTTAALGASFVWHLTKAYGDAKFTQFWKAFNDHENVLSEVYGKTVAEIETEWLATIAAPAPER